MMVETKETASRRKPDEIYITKLPVAKIFPNPGQPRKFFDQEALERLARTIKTKGDVKIPISVVPRNSDRFMIVTGERRWRGAQIAEVERISCIVKPGLSEKEIFEESSSENLCREDLTPIEKAMAYQRHMRENGMTQTQLSDFLGVSQSDISNALKAFKLEKGIQDLVAQKKISPLVAQNLASYEMTHQLFLLGIIRQEMDRRGKPLAPFEVLLVIRREAEKADIYPISAKSKRGRKPSIYLELISRRVKRRIGLMEEALTDLLGLGEVDLLSLKISNARRPSIYGLISLLEKLEEEMQSFVKKIKEQLDEQT